MPNHHKRTNAMGLEGTTIAQDWQQRQIGKKKPRPAQVWSGRKVAIRHTRPKEHQRTGT
jgi:hypothetical protein